MWIIYVSAAVSSYDPLKQKAFLLMDLQREGIQSSQLKLYFNQQRQKASTGEEVDFTGRIMAKSMSAFLFYLFIFQI